MIPMSRVSRRASSVFGLAALLAVMASAVDARAESFTTRRSRYETPQRFALEFRFSPYVPQIDKEPGLRIVYDASGKPLGKPYEATFGTMPRLMFGGEFDWQAIRIPHFGSVGPGLGIGYTNMSTTAVLLRDNSPSGDETSLDIWSTYLAAVLRIDAPWRELGIPFVPYAKAGLGLGLWRAGNTGGTSEAKVGTGTVSGKGYTFGTHVAVGLALALDFLDRSSSINIDQAVGINNTYFYAEYYLSMLNGIGQSNPLRVGANTWAMGLAFEF